MRLLLLLLLASCGADCRTRCEKRGGRDRDVNCHTEMSIVAEMQHDNSVLPVVHWDTVCDRVCIMPEAEAP